MGWLFPVASGIVFWNGLYLLSRSFLVRTIFDPLFKKYYTPPSSLAHKPASNGLASNGLANGAADAHAVPNGVPPSPKTRLTDAEVVELSERLADCGFNVNYEAGYNSCTVYTLYQSKFRAGEQFGTKSITTVEPPIYPIHFQL